MNAQEILAELEPLGNADYKKTMMRHGAKEPFFGVKIEEMKRIQKRVKKNYKLALDLYASGNYDAMYLAGLMADEKKMTKQDLQGWVKGAYAPMISEYTVPWVTSESPHGWELALEWIETKDERIQASGWATLGSIIAITDDSELDLPALKKLLKKVADTIHSQPNRVRYTMNGFVIGVGCYVKALTEAAKQTAKKIGDVVVDMGGTECKVPAALDYIAKVEKRGTVGKKRAEARC